MPAVDSLSPQHLGVMDKRRVRDGEVVRHVTGKHVLNLQAILDPSTARATTGGTSTSSYSAGWPGRRGISGLAAPIGLRSRASERKPCDGRRASCSRGKHEGKRRNEDWAERRKRMTPTSGGRRAGKLRSHQLKNPISTEVRDNSWTPVSDKCNVVLPDLPGKSSVAIMSEPTPMARIVAQS